MLAAVAVVGLTGMGAGRRLLDQGHRVIVWSRTVAKAVPLVEVGAESGSWSVVPPSRAPERCAS